MAHADLDALKHTAETITAMRDDGLDNVDAYWDRREQRAFDADAPKSALVKLFADRRGAEVIDIPLLHMDECVHPQRLEQLRPEPKLAANPFGWDVVG